MAAAQDTSSMVNLLTFCKGFSCPAELSGTPSLATIAADNVTAVGLQTLEQLAGFGNNISEDCLTINVWTKPQVGEPKKAVLLWIYGGAFTSGSSADATYNGQFIAEQEDVVLVSFNYRLNVFGFPGNPNVTQNLGLLDQRLAVEWVQNNIAAFAGDPTRITLFGQSAGSASVDYYTYAWANDPIAHAFIEESGSVFGPAGGLGAVTAVDAAGMWFNLTTALNCGGATSDPATVLSCMKGISFSDILTTIFKITPNSSSGVAASFGPTVDGQVVFSDYFQRSVSGNITKLPLLLGNADYEAGLFKLLDALDNVTLSDAYWDAFNNDVFVCPCSARANVSLVNNVPTWRYRYFGAFPNTEITTIPFSGAWHASELPILFDNAATGQGVPNNTAAEITIGSYMRGAWATFAKNPTDGLTTYQDGWPMYDPGQATLIRLAFQNMTGNNLAVGTMYDGACQDIINVNVTGNSTAPSSTSPSASASSTSAAPGTPTTNGADSSRMLSLTCLVTILVVAMSLVML
jgi:cholinesterase